MVLAFLTGALASGIAVAALTAALVWLSTMLTGSDGLWGAAPYLIVGAAVAFGAATYAAERIARARDLRGRRATGEPWAYRED